MIRIMKTQSRAHAATVFAEGSLQDVNVRLTAGYQDLAFESVDPAGGTQLGSIFSPTPGVPVAEFGESLTEIDNRRWVLDLQADWSLGAHTLVAGVNLDNSENTSTGFGAIDAEQTYWALFLEDIWEVSDVWTLIGGLRWDDFDTFGSEVTWKVGTVYQAVADTVILRANVGTGFRAPSFLDLYADSPFFVGNPELNPETSLGWDLGFTVYGFENRASFSATYFRNELEDLITADFSVFPGTSINIAEARTQGVELVAAYDFAEWGALSANYTWLEALDLGTDTRLLRRPEHTLGFAYDIAWEAWSFNVSGSWVLNREDIDAQSFLTIDGEDYFTTDLALDYTVSENMTLRATATNVFDESYEAAHGFPMLGRAVYGQVVIHFE